MPVAPYAARPTRRRLALATLLVTAASSLAGLVPARADHSDTTTGDIPESYGEPHAGSVAPSRARGRLAPATGALLGVHPEDSHSAPIDAENQHIIQTEERLGRRMDINNSYYGDFAGIAEDYEPGNPNKRGLSKLAFWDIEQGRIPLISWGCGSSRAIARGDHDDVIRRTGEAFKAFGHEFMMRYCWEMDGNKRAGTVGNPADFIDAWRRIYDIIVNQVGATNVVWVWCGNAAHFKSPNDDGHWAFDYYPGDDVVDWISADGYNWGVSDRNGSGGHDDRWRGFVEIFDEFMVWARSTGPKGPNAPTEFPDVFPNKTQVKPIQIGEYGVQEQSSDPEAKAKWMRVAHEVVNGSFQRSDACPHCGIYSDIAAMVYFDVPATNGDWRIISGPESTAAYHGYASEPAWFNQIHTIGWAPAANRPDAPPPVAPPAGTPPATQAPVDQHPNAVPDTASASRSGYWMLGSDGTVYPFGDAAAHGDGSSGAVDVEPTPSGHGYWIVDAAGRVSPQGDAGGFGSVNAGRLAVGETVTSLSATPSGAGYWIFTSRGRVLNFGDAAHLGDVSDIRLNGPVLDSIPTPSGLGYYMVGSDGGIFTFGDAVFHGSTGDIGLNAPVQSLVPNPVGGGYWLVASDGGVFTFGNVPFRGSMGGTRLNKPMTGMVPYGNGYLMVAEDGGIFNFSDQAFLGSLGNNPPARPIVSVASVV
ncbi:MAG: glycoside hydrolase family 26 protein [Acidimicrobiia bacterium]